MHSVLGPQGLGSQGSGFSMHLWFWQTNPDWQSGSLTHSGPQPVIVSGLGIRPGSHLQIGLPAKFAVQMAPGPQGLGTQGSGLTTHFWFLQTNPCWQSGSLTHSGPHPVIVSGFGMRPGSHRQIGLPYMERVSGLQTLAVIAISPPKLTVQTAPGPQGLGTHGSGFSTHRWL